MSAGDPLPFQTTRAVEFQHCDPAGIVFYPRYFEMLNSVVEEWFEQRNGLRFDTMHLADRRGVPTVRLDTKFVAPSRLGDALDFALTVNRVGGSSVELTTICTGAGEVRFCCDHALVFINLETGRPVRWPQRLHQALTAQITAEPTS